MTFFQPLNDLLPMVLSAVSHSVSEQVATRFHIFLCHTRCSPFKQPQEGIPES
jgi:hypothetical protein